MKPKQMGHTPGPWEVNGSIIVHTGVVAIKCEDAFDWVATVKISNNPNWRALARLIAASPEFLVANQAQGLCKIR